MTLVATQVKHRRGTTAENDAFTGAEGEITVDLGNKELRVHAGDNKAGGYGVARKDFKNLTDEAKNIGNWSSNVSNCITEIPQDIKLELNNGTLTLKAGSKVYVPNGSGVFDAVTISSDITNATTGADEKMFLCVYNNGVDLFSGYTTGGTVTERPVSPINYALYYNTTTNKVEFYNGSSWISDCSFPIALYTRGSLGATSIDQVFNGFGYIGSTVFALPGVKLLHPNGRNIDGTLNNTTTTVQNVIVTPGILFTPSSDLCINNSGTEIKYMNPTLSFYNNSDNVYYAAGDINRYDWTLAGKVLFNTNPTSITSLLPKTPFHAVDYNDTEYIAHQAMPSNRYVDLTLGASGSSYVAPADGYFVVAITDSGSVELVTTTTSSTASHISGWARTFVPVKKGTVMTLYYANVTTWKIFRFYYAQGAQ